MGTAHLDGERAGRRVRNAASVDGGPAAGNGGVCGSAATTAAPAAAPNATAPPSTAPNTPASDAADEQVTEELTAWPFEEEADGPTEPEEAPRFTTSSPRG